VSDISKSIKWYSWCDEAFAKAKDENKAIFISIMYPLCHWCDMMERDVFSNEECIEILDKNFVCIKVDKDERPDIDKYYQNVHTLLNNKIGGWPMSIFATPQNKPFFAGTYIALESEAGSIEGMGFLELIKLITHKIKENDENLYKNADEVEEFLQKTKHPTQATVLNESFTKNFLLQAKNNYETRYGGFSSAPKFPHANTLNTLMIIDKLYNDKAAKAMVLTTLQNMQNKQFYDAKDGGFYRYSQDDMWEKPHLEKTLYDNALLSQLYIDAYLFYKDESFLKTAKGTIDFWLKSMSKDDLLFTSIYKDTINKRVKTSQSAMMIKTLFSLGNIDEKYKQKALSMLKKLTDTLYIDSTLYNSTFVGKLPQTKAVLEDYAFLSQTFISAYNSTKDELYLIEAQKLTNKALEEFYQNGMWNFSSNEFKTKAEITDNIYTSAISVMIDVLISLENILDDKKYTHFAYKTLQYNSYDLARKPIFFPYMLVQMLRYLQKI
jgi:uncharacterized protein YyaL (SSP411 family)